MQMKCPECKSVHSTVVVVCAFCGHKLTTDLISEIKKSKNFIIGFIVVFGALLTFAFYNNSANKTQSLNHSQTDLQSTPNHDDNFQRQALTVVGADDGMKRPSDSDIRVKRAEYLLKNLSDKTKETPLSIAYATDTMSNFLEKEFGKKVSRLQLLEEIKEVYSDERAEKYGKKYSDVLGIYALAKYGN